MYCTMVRVCERAEATRSAAIHGLASELNDILSGYESNYSSVRVVHSEFIEVSGDWAPGISAWLLVAFIELGDGSNGR